MKDIGSSDKWHYPFLEVVPHGSAYFHGISEALGQAEIPNLHSSGTAVPCTGNPPHGIASCLSVHKNDTQT